jgi:hypothetical protein
VILTAIDTVYNGYRFRSLSFPVPPRKKMSARSNLAGRRFGRCVALECLGVTETGGLRWWGASVIVAPVSPCGHGNYSKAIREAVDASSARRLRPRVGKQTTGRTRRPERASSVLQEVCKTSGYRVGARGRDLLHASLFALYLLSHATRLTTQAKQGSKRRLHVLRY